jgi:serine/threonine protein kinase
MTLRSPPWGPLNLRDDYVETQLQAKWRGPRVLFKDWNNMITSFKDSWKMMGFLFSSPNIGDDLHWEVVKPLGKGGFGQVGLWQAREKVNGDVVDEIAVKQARRLHHTYDADSSKPGLAKEAWWQNQINQNGCDDILYLRRYKFYQNDNLYRLYMEYCPYGDLDRLRYRYRAYGKYLPELFLWHLFSALASAIRAMEEGPFTNPANDTILPVDSYMLHMDLKPSNVFLGYTPEENDQSIDPTLTSRYPSIKVSDFGLADVTGEEDDTNVKDFWNRGTTHFHPPVSTKSNCVEDVIVRSLLAALSYNARLLGPSFKSISDLI